MTEQYSRGRTPASYPHDYSTYTPVIVHDDTTGLPDSPPSPPPAFRRSRTPSPTPSERFALEEDDMNFFERFTRWTTKQKIIWVTVVSVFVGFAIITFIFHDNIINALRPESDWLERTPAAWLIPIAILIVLSFPPLFGQEIVSVFCGITWGLGIGLGIVAAGTLFGEIINYFVFKYACRRRSEKLEATSIQYAALTRVIQENSLLTALIIRYSFIPSHFTTTVFATCGMSFTIFLISAVLSLPKYLVHVYIGLSLLDPGNEDKTKKIVKYVVIAGFVATSMIAARYTKSKLKMVKPAIVYERRKARQAKMEGGYDSRASTSSDTIAPIESETWFLKKFWSKRSRVEVSTV